MGFACLEASDLEPTPLRALATDSLQEIKVLWVAAVAVFSPLQRWMFVATKKNSVEMKRYLFSHRSLFCEIFACRVRNFQLFMVEWYPDFSAAVWWLHAKDGLTCANSYVWQTFQKKWMFQTNPAHNIIQHPTDFPEPTGHQHLWCGSCYS